MALHNLDPVDDFDVDASHAPGLRSLTAFFLAALAFIGWFCFTPSGKAAQAWMDSL